jgi:hypothetical protein
MAAVARIATRARRRTDVDVPRWVITDGGAVRDGGTDSSFPRPLDPDAQPGRVEAAP